MNTFTLLAIISLIGAAALFIALAIFLGLITGALESIGGRERGYGVPASYLSKIRMGVRAIEVQTGALAPEVTRLNEGLGAVRDGLVAIEYNLAAAVDAVGSQGAP